MKNIIWICVLSLAVVLATTGCEDVSPSDVYVKFSFEEGVGNTTADSIGGLSATINGGAQWVSGKSGLALSFENGTAEVSVEVSSDYLDDSTFSVEAWIHPNSNCDDENPCLIVGATSTWMLRYTNNSVEFWLNFAAGGKWTLLTSSISRRKGL